MTPKQGKWLFVSMGLFAVTGNVYAKSAASKGELTLALYSDRQPPTMFHFNNYEEEPSLDPLDPELKSPLGSIWKLFVYYYIKKNKIEPPRYTCEGTSEDEIFCCKLNESIDADEALYKSCGLFFMPARLELDAKKWASFWENDMGLRFEWLSDITKLKPDKNVPVIELLRVLHGIQRQKKEFQKSSDVLARVPIDGTAKGAVRHIGSLFRVKTYTWDDPDNKGKFLGGFAGWMQDGTAVWARGSGTSSQVISNWAKTLAEMAKSSRSSSAREFVEVSFFDRYAIQEVINLSSGRKTAPGVLNGTYRIKFQNGNQLDFVANGNISLLLDKKGIQRLYGQFDINEYVARVIDREVAAVPSEAAKAFSIAIRTYLYQNAKKQNGYYKITDSSRFQRVSINPPSGQAFQISKWGDRLILENVPNLRYRLTAETSEVLSWQQARALAEKGYYFDQILKAAYPSGKIGFYSPRENVECKRLWNAENWLKSQLKLWADQLYGVDGYQPPEEFMICLSSSSQPYSEPDHSLIYMQQYKGEIEDRITAAHEFLHLAFKDHPFGINEEFIERKAKELVLNYGGEL